MESIKVILTGIVLILCGLFCMGLCIISRLSGGAGPELLTMILSAFGLVVCVYGIFFMNENG